MYLIAYSQNYKNKSRLSYVIPYTQTMVLLLPIVYEPVHVCMLINSEEMWIHVIAEKQTVKQQWLILHHSQLSSVAPLLWRPMMSV